jgi:hypothetical protein
MSAVLHMLIKHALCSVDLALIYCRFKCVLWNQANSILELAYRLDNHEIFQFLAEREMFIFTVAKTALTGGNAVGS